MFIQNEGSRRELCRLAQPPEGLLLVEPPVLLDEVRVRRQREASAAVPQLLADVKDRYAPCQEALCPCCRLVARTKPREDSRDVQTELPKVKDFWE